MTLQVCGDFGVGTQGEQGRDKGRAGQSHKPLTFQRCSQAPDLFKLMEERRTCFLTNQNHVMLSRKSSPAAWAPSRLLAIRQGSLYKTASSSPLRAHLGRHTSGSPSNRKVGLKSAMFLPQPRSPAPGSLGTVGVPPRRQTAGRSGCAARTLRCCWHRGEGEQEEGRLEKHSLRSCSPVLLSCSAAELKTVWKRKSNVSDIPAAEKMLAKD